MNKKKDKTRQQVDHSPYINPFYTNEDMMDNLYRDEELSVELSDETETVELINKYRDKKML